MYTCGSDTVLFVNNCFHLPLQFFRHVHHNGEIVNMPVYFAFMLNDIKMKLHINKSVSPFAGSSQ